MVGKTYLRYEPGQATGVLASPLSMQVGVFANEKKSLFAVLPSLEAVSVVNVKGGNAACRLVPAALKMSSHSEVSALMVASRSDGGATAQSRWMKDGYLIAVGYANGFVAFFSSDNAVLGGAPTCAWYGLGHKPDSQVLSLALNADRTSLASGAQDTDITIWDVTSQEPSYRLKGHRGGVVALGFVDRDGRLLLSGGADGWIKVWNLDVRQCVQTVVASDTQVTSFVLDPSRSRLYCGLRDDVVKVFRLDGADASTGVGEGLLVEHGDIPRKHNKPLVGMRFSDRSGFLVAWSSHTVEVFRALSHDDVKKKATRRRKRHRAANGESRDSDDEEDGGEPLVAAAAATGSKHGAPGAGAPSSSAAATTAAEPPKVVAKDEVKLLRTFFFDQKIRAVDVVPDLKVSAADSRDALQILVTFNDNSVATYATAVAVSELEGASVLTMTDLQMHHQFTEHGHRGEIRSLQFADEDSALVSCSKDGLRVWSVSGDLEQAEQEDDAAFYARQESKLAAQVRPEAAMKCTGALPMSDVTCCAVASSDVCCVGTEDGAIHLVNPVAAEVLSSQSVHVGAVKHVALRPDRGGFTSVGSDRRLIQWTLALVRRGGGADDDGANTSAAAGGRASIRAGATSVSLQLTHELELNQSPLFLVYSPQGNLAAVGLQDHNIQLFFADTMKPFLLLFGHKLPPTRASFSTDGTLCASVGMDKSLRFWGTDFGDCHRAIHAHDDYVTDVLFVPQTHYVLTASMDGTVKHWDGDNWTMIQRVRQHQRGLWCVAINSNGTVFASAGVDRCLRLMMRTEEIIFPAEEEERMAQEAQDEAAARKAALAKLDDSEVAVAGQATATTTNYAENIMEVLDLISVELQRREAEGDSYQPHLLFKTKTVWQHLWAVVESIPPSEIRHALVSLTSTHVTALLQFLVLALEDGAVLNFETAAKMVLALVTPPPGKSQGKAFLSFSGEGGETDKCVRRLRVLISAGLQQTVDRVNFNVAGLHFVMSQIQRHADRGMKFFDLSKIQGAKKRYQTSAAHMDH